MRSLAIHFTGHLVLALTATTMIFADATETVEFHSPSTISSQSAANSSFAAFTGKVTKNKVRMRYQPTLDGPILRELKEGDLLVVVGESEDFYAVQPPKDIKGYVFRTFVLDNFIEGKHVNVRLEPDVDAPIIGQLNSGDRVDGKISPANNKWLEITPPETTHFYIAKDYIEKAGGPNLIATIEKRREEVNRLMNSTYLISQAEMQKAFPEINLDLIVGNYHRVIKGYSDFPEQVSKAKELIIQIQDNYLQKKIAYLETKANSAQQDWLVQNNQRAEQLKIQEEHLRQLERQREDSHSSVGLSATPASMKPNVKMAVWMPVEENLFQAWAEQNEGNSREDFYEEQKNNSIALSGIIEPYTRSIKNKPGDYLLVNQTTNQPIAYLYSTVVDLNERLGKEIQLTVTPRSNNNFAFPAYFVLSME